MQIGYFLSCEEFGPGEPVRQARLAEQAGFRGLWISDHFHPWNEAQEHSAFVWPVIGALAQATPTMKVTTAVTCPTVRIHPAIVAQAAATCAVMLEGRFALGVGSGEALNEHITGAVPCGPDLERHVEAIARYRDAGFDELYVQQIGARHERFFELYANEVLPRFHDRSDERHDDGSAGRDGARREPAAATGS